MAIPTQAQLYEEVDRRFAAEHPDAPSRLDPDDPAQATWVSQWLEIRDHVLNEWTDFVFAEFFPGTGRLNPSDPGDATLIEYWKDIQHQISTGETGRWSWDSPPPPPLRVLAVERDHTFGGFVLIFSETVTVDEAGQHLWPGGVPSDVTIEARYGSAMHVRLSIESLRTMREDVAREITESGILTSD